MAAAAAGTGNKAGRRRSNGRSESSGGDDGVKDEQGGSRPLLLAGVWRDGYVRVLKLTTAQLNTRSTQYCECGLLFLDFTLFTLARWDMLREGVGKGESVHVMPFAFSKKNCDSLFYCTAARIESDTHRKQNKNSACAAGSVRVASSRYALYLR
jgi:hypothetical protein